MKRFSYKAKDKNGRLITGEVEATAAQAAAKLIKKKGLLVISIKPIREGLIGMFRNFKNRVKPSDIVALTRQLSTMVNAGLPITEALVIMRSQFKGPIQKIVAQILADIEGGESLSSALSKHSKVFSPTYIALVKSGELGGVLDEVLSRISDNLEKEQEFKGKVKGAMVYPVFILVAMFVVSIVMMIFVIPKLTGLYAGFGTKLPLMTRILMSVSGTVGKLWPFILLVIIGLIGGLDLYRGTFEGRRQIDAWLFKIPIFGDLQRQILLTELTRTLSLMVASGVPILDGLNITSSVMSNSLLSDALRDASKQVEKGFPLAYAFARHPESFPFLLSQMIAVGEETGKMDEVLKKISHIFEVESDQKVKTLTSAIEPIIMIVLGLGVGFLVIAVILPIYNITNQF